MAFIDPLRGFGQLPNSPPPGCLRGLWKPPLMSDGFSFHGKTNESYIKTLLEI